MRTIAALILATCAGPALAEDWSIFDNSRFGYAVAVPPGFAPAGPPPANGDGAMLASADGTQRLTVGGGNISEGSFEAAAQAAIGYVREEGWTVSYERVTPSWASYSGLRNGMVLYARSIALCGGAQYATFRYEYPERDLATLEPVVNRLAKSLRATGAGESC